MGVFSDLKPKNHAQRNGFDLSRRSVFSAKVGQIKPVFGLPTLPSSEYEIDLKQLLRTQPLQTAAFSGFGINYDFVFVPYNQLYSSFNQFISQRENKQLTSQPTNLQIPTVSYAFITYAVRMAAWDYMFASLGTYDECFKEWLDVFANSSPQQGFARYVMPYCIAYTTHTPWQSLFLNNVTAFDMYGYGNYLPVVKYLSEYVKQYLLGFTASSAGTERQRIFLTLRDFYTGDFADFTPQNYLDMIDWLLTRASSNMESYVDYNFYDMMPPDSLKPSIWPALAYQKCFHEYYRNVYYDDSVQTIVLFEDGYALQAFNGSPNYPYVKLFNFDDFANYSSITVQDDIQTSELVYRYALMFNLYPHLYKKDLVTGVLPSTQFGDVSTMITDDNFRDLVARATSTGSGTLNLSVSKTSAGTSDQNVRAGSYPASFKFSPALAISVLESRRADAMQRFKERMLRAGDKVKDIFVSHGWSEPRSESSYEPIFLGSFDGRLDINTVAATAESDNWEVGQLGANGVAAVSGSKIRFKSSDFGFIIGVMYIVKDAEFDSYQLERYLQLTEPFDFPYPELQNISLQPVTRSQVNNVSVVQDTLQSGIYPVQDVIGYLPSFMEYKTSLDRVHDEFYSSVPFLMDPIHLSVAQDNSDLLINPILGVFSDWVTPRKNSQDIKSKSYLYQQIDVADNIFQLSATAESSTSPFLVNAYFDVKAVQPLSVIGLPI